MLSEARINELTEAVRLGEISEDDAIALARQAALEAAGAAAPTPTAPPPTDPWANFKAQDKRIDMEVLADHLKREQGLSDLEALQAAIKMNGPDAAPIVAAERQLFEEQATAAAKNEWANTAEGIEALGAERRQQAEALKAKADNMRVELAARGLPVDDMSDGEVVGMIEEMAAERAAAAEASSLQANLDHIAKTDGGAA